MADKKEMSDIDSEGVYMMSIEEFQSRAPKTPAESPACDKGDKAPATPNAQSQKTQAQADPARATKK